MRFKPPGPADIATCCLIAGIGLAVAGVYVLAGTGFALLTGAAALVIIAGLIFQGIARVG